MNESQKSETRPERVQEQPAPNDRGDEWREAFNNQIAVGGLRRRALSFARGCVLMLQKSGAQVGSSHAEDLVDSAIADTWLGALTWKPSESTLMDHVKAAIRSRVRHEWKRSNKFPSASLDAHEEDEEDERTAVLWNEVEEALAARAPSTDAAQRIVAIETHDRMRALADGDSELVKVLDAMRAGATDRDGLMRATGMSARRYESVRRRLDRLLLELPASMLHRVRVAGSCTSERRERGTPCRRAEQPGAAELLAA